MTRPERASRAFDADRDGFVIGGGGAISWCLRRLEHAQARGARIYAEVTGFRRDLRRRRYGRTIRRGR